MTDLQSRARQLLDAADKMTPGPWLMEWAAFCNIRGTVWDHTGDIAIADITKRVLCSEWRENGEGIVALRNDAPGVIRDLLAENERLRLENEHGWPAVLSVGREKIKRLRLEIGRLRADADPEWLDAPDGPGWWWHSHSERAAPTPRYVDGNLHVLFGGEYMLADKCGGKWCRAIVPSLPDKELT